MKAKFKTIFTFLLLIASSTCLAGEKFYFYNPQLDYGSEYSFTPLTMILNGSYDVLRNGRHEKNVFELGYRTGFKNVWDNITHPITNIEAFGWNAFLKQEIFPTSLNPNKAQFVPNYLHHVIGSGMLYVKAAEWYDYHGFPLPYVWSFFSAFSYHLLNETIENNRYVGPNVDPIADLLIFNPAGYILFSFDTVKKFFSQTFPLYDWSLQPMINPVNGYLENTGQQFVFKFPLPWIESHRGFFYWGIYGIAGLSYETHPGHHWSFGAGTVVNKLKDTKQRAARLVTPGTDAAIGVFYDRDHSLMTSFLFTGPKLFNLRVNVYPGLVDIFGLRAGFYAGLGEWDNYLFGISLVKFPVGINLGNPPKPVFY